MKDKPRAILRADANEKIGYGHVMRCLSVAEMIGDDFECILVTSVPNDFIERQSKEAGIEILKLSAIEYDIPGNITFGDEVQFDLESLLSGEEIVVTDGYWFGTNYQLKVKETGAKLICIDDLAHVTFAADAIINHSPAAQASQYKTIGKPSFYLGLKYAMIRKVFFNAKSDETYKDRSGVTISLGASDPFKIGPAIAEFLAKNQCESITLISPHAVNDKSINRFWEVGAEDLLEIYSSTKVAIVSASSTLFEVLLCNTKAVSGYFTENQVSIHKGFAQKKGIYPIGDYKNTNDVFNKLAVLQKNNWEPVPDGSNLIDGRSPERLKNIFVRLYENTNSSR